MTVPPQHAHAVLHCNLNTVDVQRSARFHLLHFGTEPRMRSVSTGSDATMMGLGTDTASVTTFLFDARGPRAAPALELVEWSRPATAVAAPDLAASGFTALGYRVPSLDAFRARLLAVGGAAEPVRGVLPVRGTVRPALRLTDPDGVVVEVVEVPAAVDDPRRTAVLSHQRMRCADLDRTIEWYRQVGWVIRARAAATASLVLPTDPTFSLEFEQRPAAPGRPRPANTQGLYRIALAVEDVRAAHAALAADGALGDLADPVHVPMPDIPTGGFTVLFLADPDGAVVELVERPRSAVRRPAEPH